VEVCASVKAVKYIHKYIYKGPDRATLEIQNVNEIKEYVDSRYIGPVEACWHILEFPRHLEFPAVYRLPVHLKDQQTLYYDPEDDILEVANRPSSTKTQLTEWFNANKDPICIAADANDLTYQDFPQKFVWLTVLFGQLVARGKIVKKSCKCYFDHISSTTTRNSKESTPIDSEYHREHDFG